MTPDRWPEIDRLFHAALERSADQRTVFLSTACAGDTALMREVESLLVHAAAAAPFLEQPALHLEAGRLASDAAVGYEPEIQGFTIVRMLGEGGMGIVYLAQQLAPIRRQVALKLIKQGMDTRQVIARFEAERQALARMRHPHIAAVYDAGTTTDGRPYFVMEYVEGEPITEYCDRRRLSMGARLELFIDVCGAVQHAHKKGIIHRDLKPSNVLVSDADGRPMPKIIDFGVAKATDRSGARRTAFTEQGTVVGTPEYMSPEQAALSDDIDTSTDVYSLGVLLYELLVGSLPFDPAMLRAAGYDEMRRIIRESDPARPSSRLTGAGAIASAAAAARQTDAGGLTRQIQGDLDWITLKALEKDRRQRYPTVAALATDVGHYLADEPIEARAPSVAYRLRKFTKRYRALVAGATALLVVLLAGLTVSVMQYTRAEGQRAEADRQRGQADSQRASAEASVREAAVQRNAALAATAEANRARETATREAADAIAARREIEYRAYAAAIVAADGELNHGLATAARRRLLDVPASLRGWEWQHLFLKTDSSFKSVDSGDPCPETLDVPATASSISDNALTLDARGARIFLKRCATVHGWNLAGGAHQTFTFPGRVIAVGPAGESLVVSRSGPGSKAAFFLRLTELATGRVLHEFPGSAAEPICGAFSPNGRQVAIGFEPDRSRIGEPLGDSIDVWRLDSPTRLFHIGISGTHLFDTRAWNPMSCLLTFSPDSSRLASSGGTVHVWRADTGAEIFTEDVQAGRVAQPIAWSADGSKLAIGRATGLVNVLDLKDAPRIDRFDGNGFVRELPMPPGDRRFAILARAGREISSIGFSQDASRIVTGTGPTIGVWSVSEKRLTGTLAGHGGRVVGVVLEPGGRAWTADSDGIVKIWPAAGLGGVAILPGSPTNVEFSVSRDGGSLVTAEMDGGIYLWRMANLGRTVLRAGTGIVDRSRPLPAGEPPSVQLRTTGLALSPDGRSVLSGTLDAVGTVHSWSVATGAIVSSGFNAAPARGCEIRIAQHAGDLNPSSVFDMIAAPDGRMVAFLVGRCLVVRDLVTSTNVATLQGFDGTYLGPAFGFRPDGVLVLRSLEPEPSPSETVRLVLWDWRRPRVLASVPALTLKFYRDRRATNVVVSPDGQCVAIVASRADGRGAIVSIWGGDLRGEVARMPVPPDTRGVALNAGCARMASIGRDMNVRIWDIARRELLLVLVDDDQHTQRLVFTPDGRLIAGRSSGGFTIWESVRRQ
jgi:serine/threonine protein kinase/WD40 repeat protein